MSTKALTPGSPQPNKLPFYVLALLLISLGCATAVPVAFDYFDNRIYTADDVEQTMGFHPIGVLLDTDEFSDAVAEEYFFRLAAGIDKAIRTAGARSFLFTAPAHGAGTSTVIRRLGDELRGLNLKTRTIRAAVPDGMEGSLRKAFSRSELLLQEWSDDAGADEAPLAKGASFGCPESGLDEIDRTVNSAERALRRACVGYDVVLIDSDPMPTSANTEYLARAVDATVLVVKAGTTTRQELRRAARLLERLEVAGVAVVLNKIRLERVDRELRREVRTHKRPRRQYPSVAP